MQSKTWSFGLAFLVWAFAVGSAVAWGLQWSGRWPGSPLTQRAAVASLLPSNDGALVDVSAVGRLMGAVETQAVVVAAPTVASRLALLGVIAGDGSAAALIGIDGKAAKPYQVGSTVVDGLVLSAVSPRRALLAPSLEAAPTLTLDMPPLKEAAAGRTDSPRR